jgi:hypothetical protein
MAGKGIFQGFTESNPPIMHALRFAMTSVTGLSRRFGGEIHEEVSCAER